MRRSLVLLVCALFFFATSFAAMATDIPYYPDDNTSDGCGTDTTGSDNSGPDSTDSGDSWDNDNSGGYDGGGSNDSVLF